MPTAGADAGSGSGTGWSNPGNITTSNDSNATKTLAGTAPSDYLQATNFGFSIPGGATIDGIQAFFEHRCDNDDIIVQNVFLLIGGVASGSDKGASNNVPTSDAETSFGGVSDLWGLTPTPAEINASNFGVEIQYMNGGVADDTIRVDYIRMAVTYTSPTGGKTILRRRTRFFRQPR